MFSRTGHLIGHKTNLNKILKTEIISSVFSDHNSIQLAIDKTEKLWELCKYMEIKQLTCEQPMGQERDQPGNYKLY
jgi:hypothetical protein